MTDITDSGPPPVPPPPTKRKRKARGRPKRRLMDGREGFKTRLKIADIEELRQLGEGWANRGIEWLLLRHRHAKSMQSD